MKTLDTLPDMPDRLTHSQQWRTMNTYDSLPDMPDIMSATWSPFTGPGPPASIGGTPSSVPPPGAPPRQHGNSSAAACDSLPAHAQWRACRRSCKAILHHARCSCPLMTPGHCKSQSRHSAGGHDKTSGTVHGIAHRVALARIPTSAMRVGLLPVLPHSDYHAILI